MKLYATFSSTPECEHSYQCLKKKVSIINLSLFMRAFNNIIWNSKPSGILIFPSAAHLQQTWTKIVVDVPTLVVCFTSYGHLLSIFFRGVVCSCPQKCVCARARVCVCVCLRVYVCVFKEDVKMQMKKEAEWVRRCAVLLCGSDDRPCPGEEETHRIKRGSEVSNLRFLLQSCR